jgi:uncharacterized protein involved in exopolysaccharide biosynthesis
MVPPRTGVTVIANDRIATEREETDLITLWWVLWAHKWIIVVTAVVFALIAVVLSLLATPQYRAEAVVTRARDQNLGAGASLATQFGGIASMMGVELPGDMGTRDAEAVLASRYLIQEFIKRHVPLPELFPKADKDNPPTLWLATKVFQEGVLKLRDDARKGTTTVIITWKDPEKAASWANDFVRLCNELMRSRALEESSRNIKYLNEQIERTDVVEMRRVVYSLIEAETKQLMLANGRAEFAFTLVDPAVAPEIRSSPQRTLMVIVGGLIGGMLGVVVALFYNARHRFRPRVA